MYQIEPYRNPFANSLANLVGGADRARAEALQRSGDAIAQGGKELGQEAGATLNNLVKLQLDAPQREMTQIQLRQAREGQADDAAARDAFTDAGGDPDKAVQLLEKGGNYPVAMKIRSTLTEQRLKGLDTLNKQFDLSEKNLTQASQLLQGVSTDANPAAAYANVLPQVRSLVGPNLAGKLPDQYDPNAVKTATTWGMKNADVLRAQRDASTIALNGLRTAVTKTGLAEQLTTSLATSARTAGSQEEWDQLRTAAKTYGGEVADDVLKRFPEQWSPDLATKATQILTAGQLPSYQHETVTYTGADGKSHIGEAGFDPKKNAWFSPGSDTPLTNVRKFERDPQGQIDVGGLAKAVMDHPEAYNDLTDTAKTRIWPTLNQAGFTPPGKVDRGASLATAERWRQGQLRKIDDDPELKVNLLSKDPDVKAAAESEIARRRGEIEASFKVQTGGGSKAPAPPASQPAVGTDGVPAPAKQGPPVRGVAPPKAPAKAGGVPPNVTTALQSQKPGKYTLSDGSKWIVGKDGTIQPGQ